MPPSATFCYRLVLGYGGPPWRPVATLEDPVEITGDHLVDDRLVGHAPVAHIWGDRITLVARQAKHATVAAVFISVDPGIIDGLRPGDVLHLVHTGSGGLGASIIRDGRLVLGVGAVTSVPLGEGVLAEHVWPEDSLAAIDRFPQFSETTIALTVGGQRRLLRPNVEERLGPYTCLAERGFIAGFPGTDECVSISSDAAFPMSASLRWARMLGLHHETLTIIGWESQPA